MNPKMVGDLRDALRKAAHPYTPPQKFKATAPKGWEAGVTWTGESGTAISQALEDREHDHAELLREWGFDPAQYHIENLAFRTWQTNVGEGNLEWCRYYKGDIRRGAQVPQANLDELVTYLRDDRNWNEPPIYDPTPANDAFNVFLSDFQMGKGENGGTPQTLKRLLGLIPIVSARITELRRTNRPLNTLYIWGMGDLVEGCFGQYNTQLFTTDLNRRDQINLVVEVLTQMIKAWAPLFGKVVVTCVGGNHGENRKGSKLATDDADNDDVLVFEMVARICREVDRLKHVSFVIPEDELVVVLESGGVNIGITHGHLARSGGKLALAKAESWVKDQVFGCEPLADATITMLAHFHHPSFAQFGKRSLFVLPALDNGSKWFRDMRGQEAPAGLVTYRTSSDLEYGWDDYTILSTRSTRLPQSQMEVELDESLDVP